MLNKKKFFFTLFLAYILLLSFLLFVSDFNVNYSRYPLEDKVIHFAAFFFGQLLIFFAGKRKGFIRYFSYSLFLLLPAIAEIVQNYLPRRVSDVFDMLAAYFGITTCIILWYLIKFLHKYFFLKER
jgi:VanZ family protein